MNNTNNENDCIWLAGRYPQGTRIPAANDPTKEIYVGGLQICSLNIIGDVLYPCPYTKSGASANCDLYATQRWEPIEFIDGLSGA